ncbi:hypothetical protein GGP48_000119 [Salinibacter ruber]|nr:hypothetical protein [Salinibacter ruber]
MQSCSPSNVRFQLIESLRSDSLTLNSNPPSFFSIRLNSFSSC